MTGASWRLAYTDERGRLVVLTRPYATRDEAEQNARRLHFAYGNRMTGLCPIEKGADS